MVFLLITDSMVIDYGGFSTKLVEVGQPPLKILGESLSKECLTYVGLPNNLGGKSRRPEALLNF